MNDPCVVCDADFTKNCPKCDGDFCKKCYDELHPNGVCIHY